MKKIIGVILLVSVVFMSCKTDEPVNVVGVYQGQLPCADCEGIDNTLTLNEDGTFTLVSVYVGKMSVAPLKNKGTYKVDNKQVHLSSEDVFYKYSIEDDYLELLDFSGNKIESELNYKLIKKKA